jgi:hypothetical protein
MAKRPKIPVWQEIRIIDIYNQLFEQRGIPPSGREVHETFVEEQSKRRFPVTLPGLRKVQDILTKARPGLEKARDVDQPWSLGVSEIHGIGPEANKDLLELWKICLATGKYFSIRQAKWAARLRNIVQDKIFLEFWADLYALRERTCDILLIAPETSDLDAAVVMTAWEQVTAEAVGKLEPVSFESPHETLICMKDFLSPLQFGHEYSRREADIIEGINELAIQPLEHLGLSEEAEWVYVLWLQHVSEGPKWRNLSPKKRQEIVLQLRDWVKNHPWAKRRFDWDIPESTSTEYTKLLKPTQLLKMVGYESQSV